MSTIELVAPRHRVIVLPWLKPFMQRFVLPDWLAITLGPLIFAWRPLAPRELAHELAHVRQWRRHGLLYPWRYWRSSERAQAAGLDRYRENEFEMEARAAEQAVVETPIA